MFDTPVTKDHLWDGVWVAQFGHKINLSEHPPTFIEFLRRIVDAEIKPADAGRDYHGVLQRLGIRPHRPLNVNLQLAPLTCITVAEGP
jgi:hypothetical protein